MELFYSATDETGGLRRLIYNSLENPVAGNKIDINVTNRHKEHPAVTGHSNEFTLKKVLVHVLEMEDVCFHDGSALLLPEAPSGSKEGSSESNEQKRVNGVAALSLVFKQFKETPQKRLLIAGHDDTAGDVAAGFTISRKRAEGALHLLTGARESWIDHAFSVHTIKDCQQIMKFYHYEKRWDCDPGSVDGVWGQKTEQATKIFFDMVVSGIQGIGSTSPYFVAAKIPPQKTWPRPIWNVVYDFYEQQIFSALFGWQWTAHDAKSARALLAFADPAHVIVACGESFPIEKIGKDGFRSQQNRRVEFLFFDENELPPLPIKCPTFTDKVHPVKTCPIMDRTFFSRTYIKPDDIDSVLYHIKLEYFNRVRNEWCEVPDGLQLKAFKAGKRCESTCTGKNGIYEMRLHGIPGGKREKDVHFTFETKKAWIYTKDKNTAPKIVFTFADVDEMQPKTSITREELAKRPLAQRMCFYDLPEAWDSRFWICNIDQQEGGSADLVREVTTVTAPLTFCLDDIVLVDEKGNQDIADKDETDQPKPIDDDSRISLFCVNDGKLELFSPENEHAPYFSKIKFSCNRIHRPPGNALVIAFSNGFYMVGNLRTVAPCDFTKGHLLGCRAASAGDNTFHHGEILDGDNNKFGHQLFFAEWLGNFELHYFHHAAMIKKSGKMLPRSFLLVYWSGRFASNSTHSVAQAKVTTFATKGMLNSKKRWEDKEYTFEPVKASDPSHEIIPVFFFEAKKVSSGGKAKCAVTVSSDKNTGWMGTTESDMYSEDYDINDYLGVHNFTDIDGKTYGTLTVSHEFCHAMGRYDDYAYYEGDLDSGAWNASDGPFSQWYSGMPYYVDAGSLMQTNRAPRMRYYWYFVNWINECAGQAARMGRFNQGVEFKIVHRFAGRQLDYFLPKTPTDYRNIYRPGTPALFDRKVATPTGFADAMLYKIGEDETAHQLRVNGHSPGKPWNGICVVYIKIGVAFGYDTLPGGATSYVTKPDGSNKLWSDVVYMNATTGSGITRQTDWLNIFLKCASKFQLKFYAGDMGASNRDYRNILINVFPVAISEPFEYTDNANVNHSVSVKPNTHFDITVNLNDSANVTSAAKGKLTAGSDTSPAWIAEYIAGKDDGDRTPTGVDVIVDYLSLGYVQEWLRKKLGSNTLTVSGST